MRFRPYFGRVFRNFATIIESQELMDDLTSDPRHRDILKSFFYSAHEKNDKSPVERVLEKSEDQIVQEEIDRRFLPEQWRASRYSNGEWGVLYAAETEETALREVLYHLHQFYREELKKGPVGVHRRVLSLQVNTARAVHLREEEGLDLDRLVTKNESGYSYCQALAKESIQMGAQMLRAPSARHEGNYCTPIFDKTVVSRDEGHLKYLRCFLRENGCDEVVSLIEEQAKIYHVDVQNHLHPSTNSG